MLLFYKIGWSRGTVKIRSIYAIIRLTQKPPPPYISGHSCKAYNYGYFKI